MKNFTPEEVAKAVEILRACRDRASKRNLPNSARIYDEAAWLLEGLAADLKIGVEEEE